MKLNSTKIKINIIFNLICLCIIFLLLILIHNRKSNLVYAGQIYSEVKKTDSSEILFNASEKKIEILRAKIDKLSIKKTEISKEIDMIKQALSSNLKIKNKSNINVSQNFLKFQKSLLTNKLYTLKQNINEINLEQIELEYKLKKIILLKK
ncbi:MAG: effector protein [Candidatus Phytoplasma australasiaticum]|nr:effector protein [Candidatus Phytoplasma australasiaticum]MDV3153727.1 effector protein [Candidatus Phytoplasma australasiaticum]MDV3167571.1 effector protein [Candidatus Phytoplasma australasiaticum]MDV3180952.1 effector protein [Candidatus Phytoplasma australasiaticum]MDV3183175.1 effector protein [Candidatus Phytoplasma australasiaticum]